MFNPQQCAQPDYQDFTLMQSLSAPCVSSLSEFLGIALHPLNMPQKMGKKRWTLVHRTSISKKKNAALLLSSVQETDGTVLALIPLAGNRAAPGKKPFLVSAAMEENRPAPSCTRRVKRLEDSCRGKGNER